MVWPTLTILGSLPVHVAYVAYAVHVAHAGYMEHIAHMMHHHVHQFDQQMTVQICMFNPISSMVEIPTAHG